MDISNTIQLYGVRVFCIYKVLRRELKKESVIVSRLNEDLIRVNMELFRIKLCKYFDEMGFVIGRILADFDIEECIETYCCDIMVKDMHKLRSSKYFDISKLNQTWNSYHDNLDIKTLIYMSV